MRIYLFLLFCCVEICEVFEKFLSVDFVSNFKKMSTLFCVNARVVWVMYYDIILPTLYSLMLIIWTPSIIFYVVKARHNKNLKRSKLLLFCLGLISVATLYIYNVYLIIHALKFCHYTDLETYSNLLYPGDILYTIQAGNLTIFLFSKLTVIFRKSTSISKHVIILYISLWLACNALFLIGSALGKFTSSKLVQFIGFIMSMLSAVIYIFVVMTEFQSVNY